MRIKIGGVSLSLEGMDKKGINACYKKFISGVMSRPFLTFRFSNRPPEKKYSNRFDSTGLWSIDFNSYRDFCIELRGRDRKTIAHVEVSAKEGKGVIYINSRSCLSPLQGSRPTKPYEPLCGLPFYYPVDEVIFMNILPLFKGILLHACGVDDNGEGYIFSGFSGAGKSTMARQWLGKRGVRLLNDDRVIVRETKRNFYVFGTPWHGEINKCDPNMVRLKAVFLIKHGSENKVRTLSLSEAVTGILTRSFSPLWDKEGMERTMEVIERLVRKVPCYELAFSPDKGVINYIRGVEI